MAITISEIRFSHVQMLPFAGYMPAGAPYSFLLAPGQFEDQCAAIRAGNNPHGFTFPWGNYTRYGFWERYFEGADLSRVKLNRLWRNLMPLHAAPLPRFTFDGGKHQFQIEGFFYPHGVGVILTAYIRAKGVPLADIVNTAIFTRNDALSDQVRWWNGDDDTDLRMDALAIKALYHLSSMALGANSPAEGDTPLPPFTIATIIKGAGADAKTPVAANGEIHRALHGLCTWDRFWDEANLPSLDASTQFKLALTPSAAPGNLLYGLPHSRAVWFPNRFTKTGARVFSLSCYHRNLAAAALQTESMIGLMRMADTLGQGVGTMPTLVNATAKLIGRIYGGTRDTYRSWSMRARLDTEKALVNRVRGRLGLGDLVGEV